MIKCKYIVCAKENKLIHLIFNLLEKNIDLETVKIFNMVNVYITEDDKREIESWDCVNFVQKNEQQRLM